MFAFQEIFLFLIIIVSVALFWSSKLRKNKSWRAMVTPLASIIGSGFLIVGPLLILTIGRYAVLGMALLVGLSYLIGYALRYNIMHAHPLLQVRDGWQIRSIQFIDYLSKFFLAGAYLVSVAFYLKLLSSFLLKGLPLHSALLENIIVSLLLISLMLVGKFKGLSMFENLEEYAVGGKLAIIFSLLVGLLIYNIHALIQGEWVMQASSQNWNFNTIRSLAGMLIVVQGFETSLYLGKDYSSEEKVKTMRWAQWASMVIYLVFVALATILFENMNGVKVEETEIIDISAKISSILPWALIVGAVLSQFSAAVADLIGGGGLIANGSKGKVNNRMAYIILGVGSLVLIWLTDIFQITNYASRAFAAYYCLQTFQSFVTATKKQHYIKSLLFLLLVLITAFIVIFGIPATHSS